MQPRTVLLIVLLLTLVAVSGLWLWSRLIDTMVPGPVATATMAPPPTATAARAAAGATAGAQPPPGYRLAGVAVGEPQSFAIVEAPNGTTALYHLNDEVPGLGQLVRIDAERIVVRGNSGDLQLWLAPAPTPTPGPVRTARSHAPTPRLPSPPPAGDTTRAPTS